MNSTIFVGDIMKNLIPVVLPKQYNLVVGDTFQLFYRGVVESPNPYCYDILSVCEKGKNYPRYFEFTPEEEGQFELTVSVYSLDKSLLGQGVTTLNVTTPVAPKKPINILCIGDSLTAGGSWVSEVNRRLCKTGGTPEGNGFNNISFIGTCKKDEVGFEGYGGWEWSNYLSNEGENSPSMWVTCNVDKTVQDQHSLWQDENGEIWQLETIDIGRLKFNRYCSHKGERPSGKLVHYKNAVSKEPINIINTYDERPNPFFQNGKVSIKEYCKNYFFDGVEIVYILLGANGLIGNEKPIDKFCEDMAKRAKKFVDIIRADYPKAQIRLMTMPVPSVFGGTGASYGAQLPYCDDYGLTRYTMELNRAYEKLQDQYVNVVNIPSQFDSENNYPSEQKQVNIRSQKTETVGTNGLHPNADGYMQIADAVYRDIIATINREAKNV